MAQPEAQRSVIAPVHVRCIRFQEDADVISQARRQLSYCWV